MQLQATTVVLQVTLLMERSLATHVLHHALLVKQLLLTVLHVTVLLIVVLLRVFGMKIRHALSVLLHV